MSIHRLSDSMINRIAAGEVVERPASAVKELVENAIDAGARRIEIVTAAGGKDLIRVSDDGSGMSSDDLSLAIERHCTSKLANDLLDIRTLGFRGEALPSIGSVSNLTIRSRADGSEHAWEIVVDNGAVGKPAPTALSRGTVVEVRNLFGRVPARRKFLKADRAEAAAITDVVRRMALAFPQLHFSLNGSDRSMIDWPAAETSGRIAQVLGGDFTTNSLEIGAEREGVCLSGLVSLPVFNRGNALSQFFFVNGRPVRDRQLLGAIRGAYADYLPRDRHAMAVLFIDLPPQEVDVNVHPAKADVRFRDPGLVRGLVVGTIRRAIAEHVPRASSAAGDGLAAAFTTSQAEEWQVRRTGSAAGFGVPSMRENTTPVGFNRPLGEVPPGDFGFAEAQAAFEPHARIDAEQVAAKHSDLDIDEHPLGAACAQVHENYIIAQTGKGLVIVDQHAAHERIVYEKLKRALVDGLPSQMLLIPEIVDLPEEDVDRLGAVADDFARLGLMLEPFGPGAVAVMETPALLGEIDASALVRDLADELAEWGTTDGLETRLNQVAATIACHGSVRSGRRLKAEEMNALLRQIETTPGAGQCNHGRPTFIELDLKAIERLFGR